MMNEILYRVGILHGAGYAGGELLRLLLAHPNVSLELVSSRTHGGKPVWVAHPGLRGTTDLSFSDVEPGELASLDVVFVAAEHGQSAVAVSALLEAGYSGKIVDLSADFRFRDPAAYDRWFGFTHPAPDLLDAFQYGMPEIFAPYAPDTRYVANPGCFATAITLASWPLTQLDADFQVSVTAITGASGSGTRARETTHFPTRDGNIRAYKVLAHQHFPEIVQALGDRIDLAFVPSSGPWTRGIWGTAHVNPRLSADEFRRVYEKAYEASTFVRLFPDELPEMRYSVGTPFCDVGWVSRDGHSVVGFALDNLLKGAASQAVQNMNLVLGLPESAGLLPTATTLSLSSPV